MKRFLNALLVFVLVFTLAVPAMAATPADVKGTDYEDAVAKLVALGIINGYEDGTYRPANDITRAEFAKIIVVATGNEGAADILKGTSAFSDVSGDAWYSGYVAAAASFGFVKGYGDGTFGPNKNVTGQEVVTVLLRALGYNDELPGNWPYDYLIKANSLGLLEGLDFTGPANANRGLVAQLTANTLEQNLVTYDSETKVFTVTTDTFIDDKLGADFTDAVVVEPALNADDEIVLSTGAKAFAKGAYVGSWSLGEEVRYLTNADGEITYLSSAQDADNVVTGTVGTVTDLVYGTTLTVDVDGVDEEFVVASGFVFYKNGEKLTVTADKDLDDASVELFLDANGKVRFVNAEDLSDGQFISSTLAETSYRSAKIYYNDDASSYALADDAEIYLNGKEASFSDLEEGAYFFAGLKKDGKTATVVKAYDKVVTGKATGLREGSTTTLYLDKVGFEVNTDVVTSVDVTIGEEYTVLLDKDGKIVKIDGVTATEEDFYAFVTSTKDNVRITNADNEYLTVTRLNVVTTAGEEKVLYTTEAYIGNATDDAGVDLDLTSSTNFYEFTFDDDGYVEGVTAQDLQLDEISTDGVSTSKSTVTLDTYGKFVVNSDTLIFDIYDSENPVKIELSDLSAGYDVYFEVDDDDYYFTKIFVKDNTGVTDYDDVVGTFVESYTELDADSEEVYYVVLNVDGTEKTFEVTADFTAGFGELVVLDDNGSGYTATSEGDSYTSLTKGSTANTFTTNDASKYVMTADTVVYIVTDAGTTDETISVGDRTDVLALDQADEAVDYVVYNSDVTNVIGSYTVADAVVIYVVSE